MTQNHNRKKNQYRNLFIISLSFTVLFACISFYLLFQSQQAQEWKEHRRKTEKELDGVLAGLHEMEATQQAYMISDRIEVRTTYPRAEENVFLHLDSLSLLIEGVNEQKKELEILKELVQERINILREELSIYDQTKYNETSDSNHQQIVALTLQGDIIMDEIRIRVATMTAYEQYLLKKRVTSGDNFNVQAYLLLICFGLITIVISVYSYFFIQKENRQKQLAENQLKDYYNKLEKSNIMLKEAEKLAEIGSWEWNVISGKVEWSEGLYRVYGLDPAYFQPTYDSFITIIHEDEREQAVQVISEAVKEKKSYHLEFRESASGQNKIVYAVGLAYLDENGELEKYYGIICDVTNQRTYEKQLKDFNEALKKSNEELEQFAYVASHDLQEPLRKIRAFGDRLVMKLGSNPETVGHDYITRMMDAAERMQILIQDLLSFSRVSRDAGDKTTVDLDLVLKRALDDLQIAISESNATIHTETLPLLEQANAVQMHQLLLNLISNAIKFRKPDNPPVISIHCRTVIGKDIKLPEENVPEKLSFYEFSIKDNGIGFDEKYLDKIFTIFQRLHGRNEYKGTGIGLAVCKKICQNHNGFITAKSDGSSGSEFLIYLPR